MESDQIFPPYLVAYKDAMYQDQFDIEYIRFENYKNWERISNTRSPQVISESTYKDPITADVPIEELNKNITQTEEAPDINIINEEAHYKFDDGWFEDW